MKSLPSFKSLHFFQQAAKQQSFKQAALTLNVTQAAVSQQIRQLEDHLQVQLFERVGRHVRLTEAGRLLQPYLTRGFAAIEEGVAALTGDPAPGILRISTLHSFASTWLIPRLHEFQALHPTLQVQLAPGNALEDFRQGDIDLAIRMGWGNYAPLTEKKVLVDKILLVASPACVEGIDIQDPQAVFSLPWLEDTVSGIQQAMTHCLAQFGVERSKLTPILSSTNAVPLIDSAVAGRGFMLANSCLVAEHLRNGRLVKLLNYAYPSPYSLFLVAPERHFSWDKVRLFESWFVPEVQASFTDIDSL